MFLKRSYSISCSYSTFFFLIDSTLMAFDVRVRNLMEPYRYLSSMIDDMIAILRKGFCIHTNRIVYDDRQTNKEYGREHRPASIAIISCSMLPTYDHNSGGLSS